jgi:hypothetical protein
MRCSRPWVPDKRCPLSEITTLFATLNESLLLLFGTANTALAPLSAASQQSLGDDGVGRARKAGMNSGWARDALPRLEQG